MTPQQEEMATVAVEMILKHGVPAFLKAARTLQSDDPTLEEIRALKDQVKPPESFFDD